MKCLDAFKNIRVTYILQCSVHLLNKSPNLHILEIVQPLDCGARGPASGAGGLTSVAPRGISLGLSASAMSGPPARSLLPRFPPSRGSALVDTGFGSRRTFYGVSVIVKLDLSIHVLHRSVKALQRYRCLFLIFSVGIFFRLQASRFAHARDLVKPKINPDLSVGDVKDRLSSGKK